MNGRWALPAVFGACSALACAGKAERDADEADRDAGPVREGRGLYSLRIETVNDDCIPPLMHGAVGLVTVTVGIESSPDGLRGAVNIPFFYQREDFISQPPPRTDVALHEPSVWDAPRGDRAECPTVNVHQEFSVLSADSDEIVIDWKWSVTGVESCPVLSWSRSCTSHRRYHLRWVRACEPVPDSSACP